ncbi:MAG: ribosome-recycling factor [Patescibacteria group bacterium]
MRDLPAKLQSTKDYLISELSTIRAGRANISLIENVLVEAYPGTPRLTLKELATLSILDAQTLMVSPWDKSILSKIVSAISSSGTGLSPVADGDNVKVPVPSLTEERRGELAKIVSKKVEDAKIAVRTIRQDAMRSLDEQKENSKISEDEYFKGREEVEDKVRKETLGLENIGKAKKEEVMRV